MITLREEYHGVKKGFRSGRLTVLGSLFRKPDLTTGRNRWACVCECDCGETTVVLAQALLHGKVKSCGCAQRESATRHGMYGTPLYITWQSMKNRCYNPKHDSYGNYGGRGIGVCDEWKNSFSAFADWALSSGFRNGLQIDRIDNELGYFPSNCRFVGAMENCNNKRDNIEIECFGETKTLSDWSRDPRCAVPRSTLFTRFYSGWDMEKAITTPRWKAGIRGRKSKKQ